MACWMTDLPTFDPGMVSLDPGFRFSRVHSWLRNISTLAAEIGSAGTEVYAGLLATILAWYWSQ